MRKQRWIAPVWGMLAAAAFGQTASAQAPTSPFDGAFPPAAPPPTGYAAQPTYTPIAPDAASPAGYPPGMEPWPAISPYDHAVDTTYNDRGIWFREMLNHKRKYKINAEFISGRFRQPGDAPVGHDDRIGTTLLPEVPAGHRETRDGVHPFAIYGIKDFVVFEDRGRYFDAEDGAAGTPAQSGPLPRTAPQVIFADRQVVTGTGIFTLASPLTDDLTFPEPKAGILQVSNWGQTPQNTDFNDADDVDTDEVADTFLYPVSGQVFGSDAVYRFGGDSDVVGEKHENPASPGIRLSFGLEDEDESGFEWTGMWLSGQSNVFRRGLDDPSRPRVTNIILFEAPWLGTGEGIVPGLDTVDLTNAVEMLDYNTLFELKHETELAGTDLAFFHTPMVDYGWFRMRPLYGARYNYIREQFNFTGRDNGRSYAFDADGDIWDQSSGGGNVTVVNNNLVPNTLVTPFTETLINPYETTVTSKVQSHLYGPQIGFDMQAGGEHLMLTAITKTGIVANTENLALATSGFGVSEALTGVRSFKSDEKTHTRVAPFLELNANADINVFPIIPVVNRWQFLKNARIRAGWTTLIVGNLQRPLDQVVWRSDTSGGAYIKERGRDAWYTQYWNVGVNWTF